MFIRVNQNYKNNVITSDVFAMFSIPISIVEKTSSNSTLAH